MSPTMAGQGDQVQLEQSDMCLAMNLGKMTKGGFLGAALQEMQHIIKECQVEVREER